MIDLVNSLSDILGVSSFVLLAIYLLAKYGDKSIRLKNIIKQAEDELNSTNYTQTINENFSKRLGIDHKEQLDRELYLAKDEYRHILAAQLKGERTYTRTYRCDSYIIISSLLTGVALLFAVYLIIKDLIQTATIGIFLFPTILVLTIFSYSFQTLIAIYISTFVYLPIFFIQRDTNHDQKEEHFTQQCASSAQENINSTKILISTILLIILVYCFANYMDKKLYILREKSTGKLSSVLLHKQAERKFETFLTYTCSTTFFILSYIYIYHNPTIPILSALILILIIIDATVFFVMIIIMPYEVLDWVSKNNA